MILEQNTEISSCRESGGGETEIPGRVDGDCGYI